LGCAFKTRNALLARSVQELQEQSDGNLPAPNKQGA